MYEFLFKSIHEYTTIRGCHDVSHGNTSVLEVEFTIEFNLVTLSNCSASTERFGIWVMGFRFLRALRTVWLPSPVGIFVYVLVRRERERERGGGGRGEGGRESE